MPSQRYSNGPSNGAAIIDGLDGDNPNKGVSGSINEWLAASGLASGDVVVAASGVLLTGGQTGEAKWAERPSVFDFPGRTSSLPNDVAFQAAIDWCAPRGLSVRVPGLPVGSYYRIGAPLTLPHGGRLRGDGVIIGSGSDRYGSVLKRTGDFNMINVDATAQSITPGIYRAGLFDLRLDGGGYASDIVHLNLAFNFSMLDCQLTSATGGRAMLITQCQDSWFERNYFNNCGLAGGSIGVVEIDDTNGDATAHIQNLRWSYNTWEANLGVGLYMHGGSLGCSLMHFYGNKMEHKNSNDALIVMADAKDICMDNTLLVTQGTASNTIPAMVAMSGTRRCKLSFVTNNLLGYAAITTLVTATDCTGGHIELTPTATAGPDAITGTYLIANEANCSDIRVRSSYVPSGKFLLKTDMRLNQYQSIWIDSSNAVPIKLTRNGGTDANMSLQFLGSANSMYVGMDSSTRFGLGGASDINGTPYFRVDRSGIAKTLVPGTGKASGTLGDTESASQTNLRLLSADINTYGKFAGKRVFDTTNLIWVYCKLATAAGVWYKISDDTLLHTPA